MRNFLNEEMDVFLRAYQSDGEIKKKLINNNIQLVKCVVYKKYLDSGYDFDELVSVGCFGLMKAADTFNPKKGVVFSTYAVICIDNEIKTFLKLRNKDRRTVSFNTPIGSNEEEGFKLEDIYPANIDIASEYEDKECYEAVRKLVSEISGEQGEMLRLYFGFTGDGKTLKAIAELYGISSTSVAEKIRKELKIMKRKLYELGFLSTLNNEQIRLK